MSAYQSLQNIIAERDESKAKVSELEEELAQAEKYLDGLRTTLNNQTVLIGAVRGLQSAFPDQP